MKILPLGLLVVAIGLAITGCRSDKALVREFRPAMMGTVKCKTPMNLPSTAVLTIRLLDITQADAPPVILSDRSISNPGDAPIPFKLYYPYGGIVPGIHYVIEARIEVAGRLRFYSITPHEVTPQNAAQPHTVWVEPAG